METTIRINTDLEKAAFARQTIYQIQGGGNGALDYSALAREIARKCGEVENRTSKTDHLKIVRLIWRKREMIWASARTNSKNDIDDVFSGGAVSQKAKENPELYEPGKDKDSPPTRAKAEKKRGVKLDPQKKTLKTDPQKQTLKTSVQNDLRENVQRATSMTRHLSALRTLQSRTSFRIFTRSMRSFYQHLIRQIACPVCFSVSYFGSLTGSIGIFVRCLFENLNA